jgi:hypothetical protein
MNKFIVYDDNTFTIFKNYSLEEIYKNFAVMTNDGFKGVISNNNISDEDKFKIYIQTVEFSQLIDPQSAIILYEYMSGLNKDQIDIVSKLPINQYLFFKYLPTVELIEKYFNHENKINKIDGINSNTIISQEEHRNIMQKIIKYLKIN